MSKVTHETLIEAITKAEQALKDAKQAYSDFCKKNPLQAPKQPTINELRAMRDKLNKESAEEHAKANKAHQVKQVSQ